MRWLADTAEVPQIRLATLLGVSLRQFQRWLSTQVSQPEGDEHAALAPSRAPSTSCASRYARRAPSSGSAGRATISAPPAVVSASRPTARLATIAGSMRSTYAT